MQPVVSRKERPEKRYTRRQASSNRVFYTTSAVTDGRLQLRSCRRRPLALPSRPSLCHATCRLSSAVIFAACRTPEPWTSTLVRSLAVFVTLQAQATPPPLPLPRV